MKIYENESDIIIGSLNQERYLHKYYFIEP